MLYKHTNTSGRTHSLIYFVEEPKQQTLNMHSKSMEIVRMFENKSVFRSVARIVVLLIFVHKNKIARALTTVLQFVVEWATKARNQMHAIPFAYPFHITK